MAKEKEGWSQYGKKGRLTARTQTNEEAFLNTQGSTLEEGRRVRRVHRYLFVRHAHNWLLLLKFALVGGSGLAVNLLALVAVHSVGPDENLVLRWAGQR